MCDSKHKHFTSLYFTSFTLILSGQAGRAEGAGGWPRVHAHGGRLRAVPGQEDPPGADPKPLGHAQGRMDGCVGGQGVRVGRDRGGGERQVSEFSVSIRGDA
jgi:hypothetical protein